ncbi:ABC transporter ATP-binding protein [Devriesea agamarum]|uniref:ABC transporter ATP-binding protein n=1 Tax=Devriesea agamarum TaxID=472569 RepID=UPI0012ECDB5B|nr:ABC transporter ATP-binding protein [Devriesea agamarum]
MVATLRHAVKTYNGINVVDGVDLSLQAGKTTVLVGPNGSGKTTTMEMLVGLRRLTSGQAQIAGIPVVPAGEHRYHVGVQLQSSGLPAKIKVIEVIRSTACLYANPADWRDMAERLGVDAFLKATVDNLSGGQRRRLDILCAALGRQPVLVLDEPTSGVDPEGRAIVWDFVRSLSAQGVAVLASTHDMAEAEAFADELLVMAAGKIRLSGSVSEVMSALDGDQRLRIASPPPPVVELVATSGRPYGRSGSSLVVIGNSQQMASLAAQIQSVAGEGNLDVLHGPMRLEDVFSVVMNNLESGKESDGAIGDETVEDAHTLRVEER